MAGLIISYKDGVKTIKINRPERKNALDLTTYSLITKILNEDAKNDEVSLIIITGQGDYFTSGNDLKAASSVDTETALKTVSNMVEAFIKYPKLIISVVNGPAIGIGATIVALCDIVYASEKAIFDTPFLKLGLCVEGCSSYNYPMILGRSVASEMIFLGRKLNADEALRLRLVSNIIPHYQLDDFINSLHKYGKLSVNSIKRNKAAIMANFTETLLKANKMEFSTLKECVFSDEFSEGIKQFLAKSKL